MDLELVNKFLPAIPQEPGDDISTPWWVTVKILRKMGFRPEVVGNGLMVHLVGGHDGIIRDNDTRIETFVMDARNVVATGGSLGYDRLSHHQQGKAFSVEFLKDKRSYTPMYGFMPRDGNPYELAKAYLFLLQELAREMNVSLLQDSLNKLESGSVLGIAKRLA